MLEESDDSDNDAEPVLVSKCAAKEGLDKALIYFDQYTALGMVHLQNM